MQLPAGATAHAEDDTLTPPAPTPGAKRAVATRGLMPLVALAVLLKAAAGEADVDALILLPSGSSGLAQPIKAFRSGNAFEGTLLKRI